MTAIATMRTYSVLPMHLGHLGPLESVVALAHRRMRHPHPQEYTPARTMRLLEIALRFPTTAAWILVDGLRIVGYCWTEHVLDVGELHLHELYLEGGYPWRPLWTAIESDARRRDCKRITGFSFRTGMLRVSKRVGFQPRATYYVKELN